MPTSIKQDKEASLRALEPLVRLLARQLAREHFAASTCEPDGEDRSGRLANGSIENG